MPALTAPRLLSGLAIAVCASLTIPVLFTQRAYIVDWTNHLWLINQQAHALAAQGHPSFFVSSDRTGLLYPFFAFYGGTLYALAGALAVVLGSSLAAYLIWWVAGFAAAYGGTWWFSRLTGLDRVAAHGPALVVVTSAYFLTNLYGRGAWPEFVASATLPLAFAAALALMTQPRPRAITASALVVAVVVVTGSHNITLLWGTVFVALALAALAPAVGPWLWARRRRAALVLAFVVLATAINGWFLVPDITYANRVIGSRGSDAFYGGYTLHDWGTILVPWRSIPAHLTQVYDLYVQVPVLAAAWGLAAAGVHFRRMPAQLRRAFIAAVGLFAFFLVMSTDTPLWDWTPGVLKNIQFPYRLQTYVVIVVAGLVIVGLLALKETAHRRAWLGALVAVLAIGAGLAEWQVWTARTYLPISASYPPAGIGPVTWYDANYLLIPRPPLLEPAAAAVAGGDPYGDRVTLTGVRSKDAGTLYSTNVDLSPFITVEGQIRGVGGNPARRLVIDPTPGRPGSTFAGAAVSTRTPAATAGLVATAAGLLGCAGLLALIGAAARRRR